MRNKNYETMQKLSFIICVLCLALVVIIACSSQVPFDESIGESASNMESDIVEEDKTIQEEAATIEANAPEDDEECDILFYYPYYYLNNTEIVYFDDIKDSFDEALVKLHQDYIDGILQKDIDLLKPLFSDYCHFRINAPNLGTLIVYKVMYAISKNDPDYFKEATWLYENIDEHSVDCTFVVFLHIDYEGLHSLFLFSDDAEYIYSDTRFWGYDQEGNILLSLWFFDVEKGSGFNNLTIANINGSYKIVYGWNNR